MWIERVASTMHLCLTQIFWLTLRIVPMPGLQFRYVGGDRRECRKIARGSINVVASFLFAIMPKDYVRHPPYVATSSGEINACVLNQGEEVMLVITVEEHV